MTRNGSDTLDPPGRTLRRAPSRGAEKDIAISFQAENGRPAPAPPQPRPSPRLGMPALHFTIQLGQAT